MYVIGSEKGFWVEDSTCAVAGPFATEAEAEAALLRLEALADAGIEDAPQPPDGRDQATQH